MNMSLSLFPVGWHHYWLGGIFVGAGAALLFVLTDRIGGMSTPGQRLHLGSWHLRTGFAAVALAAGGIDFHGDHVFDRQLDGNVAGMSVARHTLLRMLATLAAGALFGFGLSYATMIRPEVVLSFLRFEDFGLMLVMGGAVLVVLLAYKLVPRLLARPLLGDSFHKHPSVWNRDTLFGSALFGVGWGLCGVCPGSAIAALGAGNWSLLWALGGIALGALAQGLRAK